MFSTASHVFCNLWRKLFVTSCISLDFCQFLRLLACLNGWRPGTEDLFFSGVTRENRELKSPEAMDYRQNEKLNVLKTFLNRNTMELVKCNRYPDFLHHVMNIFQRIQQTVRRLGKYMIGVIFKEVIVIEKITLLKCYFCTFYIPLTVKFHNSEPNSLDSSVGLQFLQSAAGGVPSSRPILIGHIPASDSLIIYNLVSKLMADFGLLTSLI
jgi:hypothetical protein